MTTQRFDVVVVGAGPGGETVAERTAAAGLKTALVERELIGGECAYWACIPSKTLLRPTEVRHEAEKTAGASAARLNFEEAASYRDFMIRDLDDAAEVKSYEGQGVTVFKGIGSLSGPHEIEVEGERLQSERIVLASGTESLVPPIEGLKQAGYWTNREATTLSQVPDSAIVLGGGPVGVELAQMLRRFGAEVHLIEAGERLLSREDPRVSELLHEALEADGIGVHVGSEVEAVEMHDGRRVARFGEQTVSAAELVVAVGRTPRLQELTLERAGIEPGKKGIEVDERCRAAEGIWAIGDVTGVMPFTHVAKYQGRVVCADILGRKARASYEAVPRVVFSDPEVAAVGATEAQAREAGVDVVAGRVRLPEAIARPWTYETEPRGELALLADRERQVLVGAWAVGPLASEWIHYAALAIKTATPLEILRDTVPQFPSYSEGYVKALEQLPG